MTKALAQIGDNVDNGMAAKLPLPEQGYLTTREAAHFLNVSTQFLEIARHRGVGPPYCKVGRAVRYSRTRLIQWMLSNEKGAS